MSNKNSLTFSPYSLPSTWYQSKGNKILAVTNPKCSRQPQPGHLPPPTDPDRVFVGHSGVVSSLHRLLRSCRPPQKLPGLLSATSGLSRSLAGHAGAFPAHVQPPVRSSITSRPSVGSVQTFCRFCSDPPPAPQPSSGACLAADEGSSLPLSSIGTVQPFPCRRLAVQAMV